MGQKISREQLAFVSFEPYQGGFSAFFSIEGVCLEDKDPKDISLKASLVYLNSIEKMREIIQEMKMLRLKHKSLDARKAWRLADIIFQLINELGNLSLQIDNIYLHLVRDLDVKRKWLEKVVILRRYVPRENMISSSMKWSECEKGTRRIAERISAELPLH